ncbi:hypothetical protein L1987_19923 [Smallanthus sonchifolius]|uniref:Uncharacterized protein n=1 Tax=Smallanthus sonchifolius TaxID=185202 RepID=A0ACB9IS32_9ASTR|nr:hypothetical protein L1987_19923 [Smallanthus sonchifolius]
MTRASLRSKNRRKNLKRNLKIRAKFRPSNESQAIISPKVKKYCCNGTVYFLGTMKASKWTKISVMPEEIAVRHAQPSVGGGVVVDCFAGMCGNSIQFAALGYHVVAIDIDPKKVEMALNNTKIYGVDNYVDFIVGDFLQLAPSLKGNVAFLSPPWGGPSYKMTKNFTLNLLKPVDGYPVIPSIFSSNVQDFIIK